MSRRKRKRTSIRPEKDQHSPDSQGVPASVGSAGPTLPASMLARPNLRPVQRQAIAAQLGRELGNRRLAGLLGAHSGELRVQTAVSDQSLRPGAPAELGEKEGAQRQLSNRQVRQWYLKRIALIPALDLVWQGLKWSSLRRARAAHQFRHQARLKARAMMADKVALRQLRARDKKKYGNPDGPTFDWLVKRYQAQGFKGAAVHEAIIRGASQSDPKTNKSLGVPAQER